MDSAVAKERQIPVGLIIVGLLLWLVAGLVQVGLQRLPLVMAYVAIRGVLSVVLMSIGAYVMGGLFKVSFGEVASGLLKLAAIAILPSAVGMLIPTVGFVFAGALYFSLLIWLFELETYEAILFMVVMGAINLGLAVLTAGMLR